MKGKLGGKVFLLKKKSCIPLKNAESLWSAGIDPSPVIIVLSLDSCSRPCGEGKGA